MNCKQNLIPATIGAETVYTRECSDLADPNSYKCDDGQSGITVDLHFSSVIILLKLCKRERCKLTVNTLKVKYVFVITKHKCSYLNQSLFFIFYHIFFSCQPFSEGIRSLFCFHL